MFLYHSFALYRRLTRLSLSRQSGLDVTVTAKKTNACYYSLHIDCLNATSRDCRMCAHLTRGDRRVASAVNHVAQGTTYSVRAHNERARYALRRDGPSSFALGGLSSRSRPESAAFEIKDLDATPEYTALSKSARTKPVQLRPAGYPRVAQTCCHTFTHKACLTRP